MIAKIRMIFEYFFFLSPENVSYECHSRVIKFNWISNQLNSQEMIKLLKNEFGHWRILFEQIQKRVIKKINIDVNSGTRRDLFIVKKQWNAVNIPLFDVIYMYIKRRFFSGTFSNWRCSINMITDKIRMILW